MLKLAEWNRAVFVTGDRTWTVRDVILAAHFRGEAEPISRRLRAIEQHVEQAGEGDGPDDDAVQEFSEQVRYDRDLITAEETEQWLGERGLTLDDFNEHCLRCCWENMLGDELESESSEDGSPAVELTDSLRGALFLSGEFDRMATRLSWRIAARNVAGVASTREQIEAERGDILERCKLDESALSEWLAQIGADARWLEEMVESESAYRSQRAAALTPVELARTLHAMRIPLTRIAVETLDLESLDAAREALLCVREDGDTMADVAQAGGYPHGQNEILLEDLPAELQQAFLSASPGDVLGPVEAGEGFQLCRLIQKSEPDPADADVRERVERKILERHFSELASKCVRWMMPRMSPHD